MSKIESCYKDISHKLGWKDQPVPKKYQPPIDVNKPNVNNTDEKQKTTVKPKSGGQGAEI